ncbi:unnamed protein product [Amaranthus hypochondriacus]
MQTYFLKERTILCRHKKNHTMFAQLLGLKQKQLQIRSKRNVTGSKHSLAISATLMSENSWLVVIVIQKPIQKKTFCSTAEHVIKKTAYLFQGILKFQEYDYSYANSCSTITLSC